MSKDELAQSDVQTESAGHLNGSNTESEILSKRLSQTLGDYLTSRGNVSDTVLAKIDAINKKTAELIDLIDSIPPKNGVVDQLTSRAISDAQSAAMFANRALTR